MSGLGGLMVPPPPPPLKIYGMHFNFTGMNLAAFSQYLTDSKDIVAFWNYIPFAFYIKSYLSASQLRVKIDVFVPSGIYIITEISPSNIDGRLPQEGWDWFYNRPPTPLGGIGSALIPDLFK